MSSKPSLSLLLLLALGAGCSSSSSSQVTTGPTLSKCLLTLAVPSRIDSTGGTEALAITAQPECTWTVSTQVSWISNVAPASGQGDGNVEFLVAANPASTMREGELVINDSHVRVMQEAAACRFAL